MIRLFPDQHICGTVTFLWSQTVLCFLYLAVKNFLLAVYPEACKLGQHIDHFVRFDVVDEDVRKPQVLKSMVLLASKITDCRSSKYYFSTHRNSFKVILKLIISGHNSILIIMNKKPLQTQKKCRNCWTFIDENLDKLQVHWDKDGFGCRPIYAFVVLCLRNHLDS